MSRAEPARPGRSPLDMAEYPTMFRGPVRAVPSNRPCLSRGANLAHRQPGAAEATKRRPHCLQNAGFAIWPEHRGAPMRRGAGTLRKTRASVLRNREAGEREPKGRLWLLGAVAFRWHTAPGGGKARPRRKVQGSRPTRRAQAP